jgi:hypothetical protein
MGCFTLGWLEQFLVWCVIVGAIVAIIRLLVPWVMAQVGIPILAQAINIILWAIVCIFVIYIIFALLSCVVGMGGISLLPPTHR